MATDLKTLEARDDFKNGNPFGYVNGKPVYSHKEFIHAKRHFGEFESDEALIAFAEKVTSNWYSAGHHHTFTSFYLGDYALDEPKASLTGVEYARLRELQKAARAAEKAADDAREWKLVGTYGYADNSVEEVWEAKDGEQRRVTLVSPHGDAC